MKRKIVRLKVEISMSNRHPREQGKLVRTFIQKGERVKVVRIGVIGKVYLVSVSTVQKKRNSGNSFEVGKIINRIRNRNRSQHRKRSNLNNQHNQHRG